MMFLSSLIRLRCQLAESYGSLQSTEGTALTDQTGHIVITVKPVLSGHSKVDKT